MAKSKDFIPRPDKDFYTWQDNLVTLVTANLVAWGIDPVVFAVITGLQTTYKPLFMAILNKATRTTTDIHSHRTGRKTYEQALRTFIRENLTGNKKLSNTDRENLGIPVIDTTKTERPKITDTVFFKMVSMPGTQIKFVCRRTTDSTRPSMHPNADTVEIKYKLGSAPTGAADCPNTTTSKKASFILELDGTAAGQKIYAYARWKNDSDNKKSGPFGASQTGTVTE